MEVVEFKVRLHCKACEKAVRKSLLKINGVKCVEIDMISSKITVLGYVDRKAVVKAIHKTGRRVEAWRPSAAAAASAAKAATAAATPTETSAATAAAATPTASAAKAAAATPTASAAKAAAATPTASAAKAAACRRDEYFSPRLPKGFGCIIPRWGYRKV